jgi:hypothetical protein
MGHALEKPFGSEQTEPAFTDQASFAKHVWETLSHADVSDHAQQLPRKQKQDDGSYKDAGIDYLPWSKAWMLLKNLFPESSYKYGDDKHLVDQSVEVGVKLKIRSGEFCVKQETRLAVMDARFNAIASPDARHVNDARQRCLVKAIAVQGLGLNMWTKDTGIPVGELDEPISSKQAAVLDKLITETETNMEWFLEWAKVDSLVAIPRSKYDKAKSLLEAAKSRKKA